MPAISGRKKVGKFVPEKNASNIGSEQNVGKFEPEKNAGKFGLKKNAGVFGREKIAWKTAIAGELRGLLKKKTEFRKNRNRFHPWL